MAFSHALRTKFNQHLVQELKKLLVIINENYNLIIQIFYPSELVPKILCEQ